MFSATSCGAESDVHAAKVIFGVRPVPYVDKFGVLAKLHCRFAIQFSTSVASPECGTRSQFATTVNSRIRRWQSVLWIYGSRNGDNRRVAPLLDRGNHSRPSLQLGISPIRPECAS